MFCTNVTGALAGETNCWLLEKSIFCTTSVRTLPWGVWTPPAPTIGGDDVSATVGVTVLCGSEERLVWSPGEGVPIVLAAPPPVTRRDPWSRKTSSVAVVEKNWLLLKTLMAIRCGCPLLSTPANGVRSTRYGMKLSACTPGMGRQSSGSMPPGKIPG